MDLVRKKNLRCGWLPVLLGALVLPLQAGAQVPELSYRVVKSWSTLYDTSLPNPAYGPINSPDGLAWDGSGIWITDCGGEIFAKFDEDGNLVDSFSLPGGEVADHLAWDGEYLWANVHSHPDDPGATDPTQSPDGRLIQIDVEAREIVNTIQIPWAAWSMAPMGLGWDGTHLWTNSHMGKELYRINPETLEGLETPAFANPQNPNGSGQRINSCGNAWDGHACLWVSDLTAGVYWQVDPKTGDIVSFLNPPDNPNPTRYGEFRPASVTKLFTGMTTDGTDRVWVVDEVEGNPLVYEMIVDFPTTGPCAHPVGTGDGCAPGGEPFCAEGLVCGGETGAETCREIPDETGVDAGVGVDASTGGGAGAGGGDAGPSGAADDNDGGVVIHTAVAEAGAGGGGCSSLPRADGPAPLWLAGLLLLAWRRSRR